MTDTAELIERIKNGIDTRLNDVLCEMKPDYDDSITGFNEAWDIVRKYFKDRTPSLVAEALSRLIAPPPEDRVQQIAKMLRERIPSILDFGAQGVGFRIMPGVEDLARDVLALAAPAGPPQELTDAIALQEAYSKRIRELEAAAKAPPPEEIAGLIGRICALANQLRGSERSIEAQWCDEAAVALRSQAAEVERLKTQLPEGMKHCTIRFKECEKGHGRLTADNWIDNGCPWCRIRELEAAAKAPPPEEIAGLIAEAHEDGDQCASDERAALLHKLGDALRSQAAEIEKYHESLEAELSQRVMLSQRISELKAEREQLMAAAKALRKVKHDYASCGAPMAQETAIAVNRAIAALRAAGIQWEE